MARGVKNTNGTLFVSAGLVLASVPREEASDILTMVREALTTNVITIKNRRSLAERKVMNIACHCPVLGDHDA